MCASPILIPSTCHGSPNNSHRLPQTQDSPKEAAQAEAEAAESTKYDDGAPGQGSKAETDHEQIDKPHDEPKKGTLQDEGDAEPQPTELGKAREQARQVGRLSIFIEIWKRLMLTGIPVINAGECAKAGRRK